MGTIIHGTPRSDSHAKTAERAKQLARISDALGLPDKPKLTQAQVLAKAADACEKYTGLLAELNAESPGLLIQEVRDLHEAAERSLSNEVMQEIERKLWVMGRLGAGAQDQDIAPALLALLGEIEDFTERKRFGP